MLITNSILSITKFKIYQYENTMFIIIVNDGEKIGTGELQWIISG